MNGVIAALNQVHQQQNMAQDSVPPELILPYKQRFIEIAKVRTNGRFIIDERNKDIVTDLFNYFLNLPGRLDNKKGLWLDGPVGTGKSMLMYVFSEFMKHLHIGFQIYICSSVTTEFALTGDLEKYLQNSSGVIKEPVPMCFDELGREPIPASYYGQKMNVLQHILHVRYSYWQIRGVKTYITTNTTAQKVEELYDTYIRDRRAEMFNLVPVTGESRRL